MKLKEIEINDSFYVHKQLKSLTIIFQTVAFLKVELQNYTAFQSEIEFIKRIRSITNEMYSGCEIINELLRGIYRNDDRYRGTQLKNGFNDNFKEVYKACILRSKDLDGIYKDQFISEFFQEAKTWYVTIHDIRTQEVHYEVGRINRTGDNCYYINGNRNGTSKTLYTNASNEIKIEIKELLMLVDEFLNTEDKIVDLILGIYNIQN